MSLEQKEAIAEELDKAAYYIERNANAKILFHALTIKIFHIVKNNVVISDVMNVSDAGHIKKLYLLTVRLGGFNIYPGLSAL